MCIAYTSMCSVVICYTLRWRHNGRDGVSNHQPDDCLLNRLFGRRSKKTSRLRVTSLCAGNSPLTGEFPAQMASNLEIVSIWWRNHEINVECHQLTVLALNVDERTTSSLEVLNEYLLTLFGQLFDTWISSCKTTFSVIQCPWRNVNSFKQQGQAKHVYGRADNIRRR